MGSEIATTRLSYRWILWYHDPDVRDYSIESYIKIGDINTPQQFWTIVDNISKEAWEAGYFFFMKAGYPPIYEAPENIKGGSWSKTISRENAHNTFVHLMVNCISNELLVERKETLVGVTLSNKNTQQDSVIRVYNTTSELQNNAYLKKNIPHFQITSDVSYTANVHRDTSNNNSRGSYRSNRGSYRGNNSTRGRK